MKTLDEQLSTLLDHHNRLLGRMMDPTKARQVQEIIDALLEVRQALAVASLQEGTASYTKVVHALDEANASAAYTLGNLSNFALGMEKARAAAQALDDLIATGAGAIG